MFYSVLNVIVFSHYTSNITIKVNRYEVANYIVFQVYILTETQKHHQQHAVICSQIFIHYPNNQHYLLLIFSVYGNAEFRTFYVNNL